MTGQSNAFICFLQALLEGSEPWANGGFTSLEYLHFIQNLVYIPIFINVCGDALLLPLLFLF
jgi:hypothetical protein